MIFLEKLSLFNIDHFRKLYKKSENAYICDRSFFEIYCEESFIMKFIMRKQVKLFKLNNSYIGYIWNEYPYDEGFSNIYGIYLKEEYIDLLNSDILLFFNCSSFKFDMFENSKAERIVNKLKFDIKSRTALMQIETKNYNKPFNESDIRFRRFKEGKDESLRCNLQNSVFYEKNRVPLSVQDVYIEEDEDYYIKDSGVFVFDDKGQPVGYGQVILDRDKFTIVNLGILNQYRKQGYGEKLVDYLIGICKKNHIDNVYIRVDKDNYNALSLYNKLGFKEYKSFVTWCKNID